jgi:hypothetical protein
MRENLPTFQEVRKRHDLTLNMLIEDSQVDPRAVLLLDTWGLGEACTIDTLLASLSRLSGTLYRRDLLNIGGFFFSPNPPYEQVSPDVVNEAMNTNSVYEEVFARCASTTGERTLFITRHRVIIEGNLIYEGVDWGHAARLFLDCVQNPAIRQASHEVQKGLEPIDTPGLTRWRETEPQSNEGAP